MVKVNQRSLFEQSWYATYQVSRPWVTWFPRRFLKFLTIYGHVGHVCQVTWSVWTIFFPSAPKGSTWNMVTISPVALEDFVKIWWESWVKDHRMTLISCSHKSLCTHEDDYTNAFITFHKILCSSIDPYLTLPQKRSRSVKGHQLYNRGSTQVSSFNAIGKLVQEKKTF